MLTTTITRAAFAKKMKQVAEEGFFVEYKRVNEYWSGRVAGVRLPTEMIFLVGASPYRFVAVSIDEAELSSIPEYACEIISKSQGSGLVYAITCKPINVPHKSPASRQVPLTGFLVGDG